MITSPDTNNDHQIENAGKMFWFFWAFAETTDAVVFLVGSSLIKLSITCPTSLFFTQGHFSRDRLNL